jgi:phage/plasmid-like protein (TIGR03299 family)
MAHQLSIREDGTAEMAYVGEVPWHHLGTQLLPNAPKSRWLEAAGFDHEILSQPVRYLVDDEEYVCTDRVMMHRSDNHRPLGVVSKDYQVVQPAAVLDFFDDVVKAGNMTLETAGTLFGGKQYWALAKLGENAVLGRDTIKGYLLLSTSCDGSRKTVAKLTCVRVVCDNTLRMSDKGDLGGMVEVSHRSQFDADAVKKALGVAPKTFDEFMASLDVLAKKKLRKQRAEQFTEKVFGEEARAVPHVMALFEGDALGHDMPGFAGTAYGWVNCVTEYVDHWAYAKTNSHRISNSLLGKGDQRKRLAYDIALEYAS